ncbi:MAG: hypothetical protein U1F83_13595 [Verrucomicrobiota bacterium]
MSEQGKEQISQWLRAAPAVRGMLVRGVRFPDQTFISDVDARDFPAGALEQAWRVVDDTFQVLSAQHFPPTRLSWVYERLVLHCVQRPDGSILGVFLARKTTDVDVEGLNRLLSEFQDLKVSDSVAGTGS